MDTTTGGLIPCMICSTVLHVEVPNGKFFGTHLVRCGHCLGDFDITITGLHVDSQSSDYQPGIQIQSLCSKHNTLPPFASSTCSQQTTATTHHVVKPPEKKHRLPSAYNRFMKEEIQRIKAAKPDIPHREAFSMASKNWARRDPRSQSASVSDSNSTVTTKSTACHHEGIHGSFMGSNH